MGLTRITCAKPQITCNETRITCVKPQFICAKILTKDN